MASIQGKYFKWSRGNWRLRFKESIALCRRFRDLVGAEGLKIRREEGSETRIGTEIGGLKNPNKVTEVSSSLYKHTEGPMRPFT